jgi:4-amino-4-deoxy-L-arabinose transferase-like glycosyltransferase
VPWYAAQIPEHGLIYIQSFFIGENVGRYSTSMVPSDRSMFFYLPVLFGDLFPWAPLLIVPILAAWRGRTAGESDTDAGIRRLLWVWIVTITGLFTFSATKQDLYIFPVVPAVAVLVAHTLVTSDFGMARRAVAGLLAGVAGLSVVAAGGLWWLLTDGPYAMRDAALIAGLLSVAGLVTMGLLAARRGRDAVVAMAAGFVVLNYAFVLRALPDSERFKPAPPIAAAFTAGAGADAQLTALDVGLPSLVYYTGRTVHELGVSRQVVELLSGEAEVWVVLPRAAWEAVAAQVSGACVVLRQPQFAFNARLSDIIDRTPPEDILLVSNRCRG